MKKHLLPDVKTYRIVHWLLPITLLILSAILASFAKDKNEPRKQERSRSTTLVPPIQKSTARSFEADPIKFTIRADKSTVAIGEELIITLTAQYLNIPSALLFTTAGSNAFRLKLLLPEGFVQTGGDYSDYIGTELSPTKPTVTYILKGYFEKATSRTDFRLLRSHANADASSLFVEKTRLSIRLNSADLPAKQPQKSAREGSCTYSEGQYLFTFNTEVMYAHYYNGILFAAYQDGSNFRPQHWLTATGLLSTGTASCFAETDPHTSTPNPTGNCSYTEGQYLFTFNTEVMYAHYYNGVLYAAYQNGSSFKPQHWLAATGLMSSTTANCFAENDPHTSTPNPNPNPTGNCSFTEGQYLFTTSWGEAIYAHYYNGILFAAYQDGSNFKLRQWLTATGLMSANDVNCFAENDPHTTTPNPNPGSNNGTGLLGTYYNNPSLSGNPVKQQVDAQVNFTWGDQGPSPASGVNATNMSVRWSGQVEAPVSGTYKFKTLNDDATRLTVNDQLLINDWPGGHAPTWLEQSINLTAGQKYWIILDFNQGSSGAQAQLYWEYPGQGSQLIPQSRLYPDAVTINNPIPPSECGTGSGLTGFYSNSSDLSGNTVAIRTDEQINFNWSGSPIPGLVNADGFSIRWLGQVEAPISGNYTFKTNNDDGSRLWVNGQLLIDDWNGHGPTWQQGSIYLTAGQKYDIVMDFADLGGGAQAQLFWEYYGQILQLVPKCRLYPIQNFRSSNLNTSGHYCYISTPCIDYIVDCDTHEAVDFVFYPCGPGGSAGGPGTNNPGTDDPGTNNPGTNNPGSSGGVPGGPKTPGRPLFFLPIGLSAEELALRRFYTAMSLKGIFFTNEEKAVINEDFDDIVSDIEAFINTTGEKPTIVDGSPGPWDRFLDWLFDTIAFDTGDLLPDSFDFQDHPQINNLQVAVTTGLVASIFDGRTGNYQQKIFDLEIHFPKGQMANGGYMTKQIAQRSAAVFSNLAIKKVQTLNAQKGNSLDWDSKIKIGFLNQLRILAKARKVYIYVASPPTISGIIPHPAHFK